MYDFIERFDRASFPFSRELFIDPESAMRAVVTVVGAGENALTATVGRGRPGLGARHTRRGRRAASGSRPR